MYTSNTICWKSANYMHALYLILSLRNKQQSKSCDNKHTAEWLLFKGSRMTFLTLAKATTQCSDVMSQSVYN